MPDRSFVEQIFLDEIAEKNKAIHAYDHILWTVRSGFLTLFFIGWGFVLKGILNEPNLHVVARVIIPMLFLSMGLSVGGFVIDLNYVRRKFRVIAALNRLYSILLVPHNISQIIVSDENQRESLLKVVRISGDSGDRSYRIPGYRNALMVSTLIYFIPIVLLLVGLYIKDFI
jgi:hypothetical protein